VSLHHYCDFSWLLVCIACSCSLVLLLLLVRLSSCCQLCIATHTLFILQTATVSRAAVTAAAYAHAQTTTPPNTRAAPQLAVDATVTLTATTAGSTVWFARTAPLPLLPLAAGAANLDVPPDALTGYKACASPCEIPIVGLQAQPQRLDYFSVGRNGEKSAVRLAYYYSTAVTPDQAIASPAVSSILLLPLLLLLASLLLLHLTLLLHCYCCCYCCMVVLLSLCACPHCLCCL
jgi:hypothetical protein